MDIQLSNLHYRYSSKAVEIFHSLSWFSSTPEVIGILGVNGCGKSTLLRLIGGLLTPTSGEIRINGKSITNIASAMKFLCLVPENAKLFLLGPTLRKEISRLELPEEEGTTLLENSGLLHLAEKKIYALSEGQRRLAAIWLAFQLNRQIILLDEPTIGMDSQGKIIFSQLLQSAVSSGKTVIIASNDSRILPLFDRIAVIQDNGIKLDGSPKDVLYKLEATTQLIPNQVVRLITAINRLGADIPHYTNINQLNNYLTQVSGRDR